MEISGIPSDIPQNALENAVIKVFEEAGVEVHGEKLKPMYIHACHRIGTKGITICKFTNRKFAREGLVCGRNLKDKKPYGESKIYINTSFCREYKYLNFVIRKCKADGRIFRWKVRNGTNFVQLKDGDEFTEISHKNDLIELNLLVLD